MRKLYSVRRYAELQVTSHFSFLRGASDPQELVLHAAALGLSALAITDRNTLAGVVRAHRAVKEMAKKDLHMRLVVGARLDFADGPGIMAYPTDRQAYGHLSHLLTVGKRRAPKGQCHLNFSDLLELERGQKFIIVPPEKLDAVFAAQVRCVGLRFPRATHLAIHKHHGARDRWRLKRLADLAEATRVPLVVTNDVHAHAPERRPLQDVMTCIREGCRLDEAGFRLHANAERHLKSPYEMSGLFRDYPDALDRTVEIAEECQFSLEQLKYEYPDEPIPEGRTAQEHLTHLTWHHAAEKYPAGIPGKVRVLLEKELVLIEKLDYARYFLTIHEIVQVANEKNILCQGRGSAANSAVCYVLGITAVDPDKIEVLVDRFMSMDRDEPPDIDVDFEHERREEIIQWIYGRYGRDRAGIVATTITYRSKSAMRDVAKAFGLSDRLTPLTRELRNRERAEDGSWVADPDGDPRVEQALALASQLRGFPRHLSQHTGGFVITRGPLSHVVPIENAAMEDRTVIEWNKDDLDALGMLKIDVLALGMLTCLRKGLDLIETHYGRKFRLGQITQGTEAGIYRMLSMADTVGLFQVESRAQMSMLPRLKPEKFYDLVVEVAIVRPGPIQGDMVHPYLRRREGKEPIEMPSEELRAVLERTHGVPLFQEQAMKIAMVAAGFSSEKASELRSAMATFRNKGTIGELKGDFIEGMVRNDYKRDFAERCFRQIEGFGEYGFPESHAASFALLVYASAWLKYHYPAVFTCAILNSQPMGFYLPAQLVRDAQDRGVEVRPVDVGHSDWDCTLEPKGEGRFALRLGLRLLKGLREDTAKVLAAARANGDLITMRRLWHADKLDARAAELLGHGDAWNSLGLSRRAALWAAKGFGGRPLPLFAPREEAASDLRPMLLGEEVTEDYAHLGLSLKGHPMALLRTALSARGVMRNKLLSQLRNGSRVTLAGVVLIRQQPGTAKGVIFVTIEDETGAANLVLWPDISERFERVVMDGRVMQVTGRVQADETGLVIHVVAEHLVDLSDQLTQASAHATLFRPENEDRLESPRRARLPRSRDFH
ncbi:MAG: error-prone DNA polymerase [Alphaproteobacteria bacterium]